MSDDLKNTLSNLSKEVEQEKLLDYLNRHLSEAEQHELESHLNDDAFMSDAVDGLQELHTKTDVSQLVNELNSGLKKQLEKNKQRRNKRSLKQDSSAYYAVIIILLLAIIAFVIIRMARN